MPQLPWRRSDVEPTDRPDPDATAGTASLGELVARVADDDGDRKAQLAALTRGLARGLAKLAPFLAGAVAGGVVNRRATRSLGEKLDAELTGRPY